MKKDMKCFISDLIGAGYKKAIPLLSFPSAQLLGVSVRELLSDSDTMARGMKAIADTYSSGAAVSMMDLSVEAEEFGAQTVFSDGEVPTVVGRLITSPEDAEALKVPAPGMGRTGINIEAIRKASELITDRPILAGAIGPFSLAGRLMDMTEIMVECYFDPDTVHKVLEKCTEYIISYITCLKSAGANGVVIAEPAAGLLSPDINDAFSVCYCKKIVEAVSDDTFAVIYHNCGNVVPLMEGILSIGADGYHFGNAVDLCAIADKIPSDVLFMGNIDPVEYFKNGTPGQMTAAVNCLMSKLGQHKNFVLSSGCDIPPLSKLENIKAFFDAAGSFDSGK